MPGTLENARFAVGTIAQVSRNGAPTLRAVVVDMQSRKTEVRVTTATDSVSLGPERITHDAIRRRDTVAHWGGSGPRHAIPARYGAIRYPRVEADRRHAGSVA